MVVGGGPVAASKLAALQAAGAEIIVVAPEVCEAIRSAGVAIERRAFAPADLDGAWFVVAAAPPDVNREVAREGEKRQVFVNAVDDPDNASVYLGGVVRRGGVAIGISTEGSAPALAGLLREAIDAVLPADLDDVESPRARAPAVVARASGPDGGAASRAARGAELAVRSQAVGGARRGACHRFG